MKNASRILIMCLAMLAGAAAAQAPRAENPIGTRPLPALSGATGWLNSPPLTAQQLKGKVVLIDFWDYSCINCIRAVPYVRAWADKYRDAGLVVIGVHSPEFDVEKNQANVEKAAKRFGITYPIAVDSNMAIWNGFRNQYWPAHYFLDGKGRVRFTHFGEGSYDESEKWIQQLLAEGNAKGMPGSTVSVHGQGAEAAADMGSVQSPETYIGHFRAQHFASPGGVHAEVEATYTEPTHLELNGWGLGGKWFEYGQRAEARAPGDKIVFRFHARDLHMVLGPASDGKPVHYKVTLDGHAPGANHGVDTDEAGKGIVSEHRLYQLIRQSGTVVDHTFEIEFEDAGVQAFSFTFG